MVWKKSGYGKNVEIYMLKCKNLNILKHKNIIMSKEIVKENKKLTVETKETGVIYKITNTVNNKSYIGQANSYIQLHGKIIRHGGDRRWKEHISKAIKGAKTGKFYDAIREHGADKFQYMVLEITKLEDLDDRETYHINKFDTTNENFGYNVINTGITPRISKEKNLERINKIKSTMKDKWKDDEDYAKRAKEANFKAVMDRTDSGQTRQKNKDLKLPGNIYKTDKGYDIRIMRDGKYKITSVEDNSLTDEQKLAKAIERKKEILENLDNGIDDSHEKKKDHNGNELPQGILRDSARGNPGYRVKVTHNKKIVIKTFTDGKLTMDQKLQKAKEALANINKDKDKAVNGPKDRNKSPDHNGNSLPAGIIYTTMKNGNDGYIVTCKGITRKEFSNQKQSLDERLNMAKKYYEENKN